MKLKRLFSALFCILLLTITAFAGDIEWLFTHNAHDSLIIGEITDIENGVATIKAAHHLTGKLPKGVEREQMTPSEIEIKSNFTYFGFIDDNYRQNKVGDYVVFDVNKNGDLWEIATAAYLADNLDFKKLNILLPSNLSEDSKNIAAAHTLFIKSFINSDGTSVIAETEYQNALELKTTLNNDDFIYYSTAKPSELNPEENKTPQTPNSDYTRLYIVTGCGILFVLLMLLYRKMK